MPIGELARKRDVPVQFLEQLFAVLRRAGVISSQRGVKGGYRFAREPAERHACWRSSSCSTDRSAATPRAPFADAAAAARKVLAQTTIADVIERETREAGASMYHI